MTDEFFVGVRKREQVLPLGGGKYSTTWHASACLGWIGRIGSCADPAAPGRRQSVGVRGSTLLQLLQAKERGGDLFEAIESVMPWQVFTKSVTEAEQLAQPEAFDFLHLVGDHFSTLRRYVPEFLDIVKLRAAPAAKDVLAAIDTIRAMNLNDARKAPAGAPTSFIKKRWVDQTSLMLPRVKITELLMEVDG